MRRLRLVRTPGEDASQEPRPVDYSRKSLKAPLTITPPTLNVSDSQKASASAYATSQSVKKINTLTPQHNRLPNRPEEGEESISHRRKTLRESRDESRKSNRERVYRMRRALAIGLGSGLLVVIALVALTVTLGLSGAERITINPQAAPDTVIAEVGGIPITTPVRPEDLQVLGYHEEGERFVEMTPSGRDLGSLFSFLSFGPDPENIGYFVMDGAGRGGPDTGAVDVGAEAGTEVFSPVTGVVTSIRPDPRITGASVVEIQPTENTDLRVYVTLVEPEDGSAGVKSPVKAGETSLGTVADSASVLDPQLAGYTEEDGDHVTVFASNAG